jgi:MFS family permease
MRSFTRDRLTWVAYVVLAWFAYLQAAPGLVIAHLRGELDLSYAESGLHLTAFSAGSLLAGLLSRRLEHPLGRRRLLWAAVALMGAGAVGLTAGRAAEVTVASVAVMGLGGGLVLATIQGTLADHHGGRRTIALAEANVAASVAYVALSGVLSLAAAVHLGWRAALLASLAVPLVVWWSNRRLTIDASPTSAGRGRLPWAFWVAAAMLFFTTAAEWCVAGWGATFVKDVAGASADTAVAAMAAYFGGVLTGRVLGSGLARRYDEARLLAVALALTVVGFAILWPSAGLVQALVGLSLLGIGLGNLFPMGVALTVALAPTRATTASGRAVSVTSFASLIAPLTVGALADATSLATALWIVPVCVALAAVGLAVVVRQRRLYSAERRRAA